MRRWFVLGTNFYVQFITYGIVYSFGIFLPEISSYYGTGKGETTWIGSLSACSLQLSGPIASVLTERYGPRAIMCIGAFMSGLGLLTSAFARDIYTLYFTYGIVLGVGGGLMTVAGVVSVTFHFKDKRSLALILGVVFAGGTVGMTAFPIFLTVLFDEYGWKMSLLIVSGLTMNGIVCGTIQSYQTQKNREERSGCVSFNRMLFRNNGFNCYVLSALVNNMGYYIPLFLLPEFALHHGISDTEASSLITTQGMAAMFGRLFFGYIADKKCVNVSVVNAVLPIIDGVLMSILRFASSTVPLLCWSAVHGYLTGPFMSLIAVSLIEVVGLENLASAYGIWLFTCGVGSLLGPPIAGWIFDITGSFVIGFYVAAALSTLAGALILWIPLNKNGWCAKQERNKYKVQNVFSLTSKKSERSDEVSSDWKRQDPDCTI